MRKTQSDGPTGPVMRGQRWHGHNPVKTEREVYNMDERIRSNMNEIKALAERHGLPYEEWEDEGDWMCQIGTTGDIVSTIYWYTIALDGAVQVSHRGTTPGCFWTDWEPV